MTPLVWAIIIFLGVVMTLMVYILVKPALEK